MSTFAGKRIEFDHEARGVSLRVAVGEKLRALGWDPETCVFSPDPEDLLLGTRECIVTNCSVERPTSKTSLFCSACGARWRAAGQPEIEAFAAIERRRVVVPGSSGLCLICRVPGHERPSKSRGLCLAHSQGFSRFRRRRGPATIEDYVAGSPQFAPTPLPTFGPCRAGACDSLAGFASGLCHVHQHQWSLARVAGHGDIEAFCRRAPVARGGRSGSLVLAGLDDQVQEELLMTIAAAVAEQKPYPLSRLRPVVDLVRASGCRSVLDLDVNSVDSTHLNREIRRIQDTVRLNYSSIDDEVDKDSWDLRLWGLTGRLAFDGSNTLDSEKALPIVQPWLKATAKAWAKNRLAVAKRSTTLAGHIRAVGLMSHSLSLRADRGNDPASLSHGDIELLLGRLNRRVTAGELSDDRRAVMVRAMRQFLRTIVALGLTAPHGPAWGLPSGFSFAPGEVPKQAKRDREDQGDALPEIVVEQLLDPDALALMPGGQTFRNWFELQVEVGRRPDEICSLRYDCLDYDEHVDENGDVSLFPVLRHDMPKVERVGCRLPLTERAAKIIRAQQDLVAARFPDLAPSERLLFPRRSQNRYGTRAISPNTVTSWMREWVRRLPALVGPDLGTDGEHAAFNRDLVYPYALRHTYAQRHADAGTPVEVLAELLGHDNLDTTSVYYRVSAKRKRKAVQALAPLQVDRRGVRSRPGLDKVLASVELRDAVAQIAVPMGSCVEPANVKSHGQSCAYRHRCFGCAHYRADPSYLPELRTYLNQLLTDRERLLAAEPILEPWAVRDAMPSEEEIAAVRRLIAACEAGLDSLAPDARTEIEEQITLLRRGRAQLDTAVPVHLRLTIGQPNPVLFPGLAGRSSAAT